MKVLKKGRKQKGWSIKETCTGYGNGLGGCGAKLLVEEADIYEDGSGGDGDDYCRIFICPECGVVSIFLDKEIPSTIWEKTQKRRSNLK